MKFVKFVIIFLNFSFSHLVCLFFSIINRNKKKVLVYTDSRGFNVEQLFYNRNPFSSYVGDLIFNYNVTFRLMPFKHTTIIDFLSDYEKKWSKANFDFVVLHCGIVDFSPRKQKNIPAIQKNKVLKIDFKYKEMFGVFPSYETLYNNDLTASLYSISFLESYLLPKLMLIKGLIFIEPNKIDLNWNGTYPNSRPQNMNLVLEYVDIISSQLDNVVKLSSWDYEEVRRYTTDNIHYNIDGFNYISKRIQGIINER